MAQHQMKATLLFKDFVFGFSKPKQPTHQSLVFCIVINRDIKCFHERLTQHYLSGTLRQLSQHRWFVAAVLVFNNMVFYEGGSRIAGPMLTEVPTDNLCAVPSTLSAN